MSRDSKSKVVCCVYGCKSKAKDDVSFHYFPKENVRKIFVVNEFGGREMVDVRKLWEKNLQREENVTNFMRVCSKHFVPSDFLSKGDKVKRKVLKTTAVPSINLPDIFQEVETRQKRIRLVKKLTIEKKKLAMTDLQDAEKLSSLVATSNYEDLLQTALCESNEF